MIPSIILTIFYLLAPAGVIWLCKRFKALGKIGPILLLYFIGVAIGNLSLVPFIPEAIAKPQGAAQIQDILTSAMVPLSIPLFLFGCTFRKSETRSQVLALVTGMVAVVIAVVCGYLIFARNIPDGAKIGGMLTGVYTGGTINLAALKTMLGVPDETFILLNSYDMVISFLLLVFLMAIGIKLLRKFLPANASAAMNTSEVSSSIAMEIQTTPEGGNAGMGREAGAEGEETDWKGLLSMKGLKDGSVLVGLAILMAAVSAGIAVGVNKLTSNDCFMTVFILMITTLGIAGSFMPFIRKRGFGETIAMYCIYVFCITVASMADLTKLDVSGGLNLLGYLTLVVFGSLLLQVIFAKIFKIDADTLVVSCVAFICSPPFVPMIAAAMKNRSVIVAGLSIGIIGYAVGNYLGYLVSLLLGLM